MKKIITASIIIACGFMNKATAQANKTLSNLTVPTAINASLLPGAVNSVDLGSAAKPWKNIYLNGNVFYASHRVLAIDTLSWNTAIGEDALKSNTIGGGNIAVGKQALYSNIGGYNNAANGSKSLYSNTTGFDNTATGCMALYSNTTGFYNTASGSAALYSNTTGKYNVANGQNALYNNTTGAFNTASGFAVLGINTTGNNNTAYGSEAMQYNLTGNSNVAIGARSLYANTMRSNLVAIGDSALYFNGNGAVNAYDATANVAVGSKSLYSNTTGRENGATGYRTLYYNTKGVGNTANGYQALLTNSTGSYNVALGRGADVASGNLTNAMALGANAVVNASNKVIIGSTTVTVIGGFAKWTDFSDGRFKSNIKQNVPGLAFINKLNPVTYTLDIKKFDRFVGKKDSFINSMQAAYAAAEKKVRTGFIAQEVERAAKELNYDFDGVNAPTNDKDNYSIAYADFVPSLVKSVQELSNQNEIKDRKIDSLEQLQQAQQQEINELKRIVLSIQQMQQPNALSSAVSIAAANVKTTSVNVAALQQNIPNPFSNSTTINYILPQQYAQAYIMVTDKNGRTVKQLSISGRGKGSITINAGTLPSGSYYYFLIIDGKQVAAKQMMKIK